MVQRDKNPDTDEVVGHAMRGKAHEEHDDTDGHAIKSGRAHDEPDDAEGHGFVRKF